eukprot:7302361-Ditylum_brightwellii.AAC.1
MVIMMVLMMVLMVLRSTLYISYMWLIVVGWIEASKISILFGMKMMMLTMVMKINDDSADKHLPHLPQVKNNGNHDVIDINFTCIVKNTPTSLKND